MKIFCKATFNVFLNNKKIDDDRNLLTTTIPKF